MAALAVAADALERGDSRSRGHHLPRALYAGEFRHLRRTASRPAVEPVRRAPLHDWAAAQGAVFEPVGLWQRARYFPRPGETMQDAVARECRAVRSAAGIFDASTLGKIEVVGPDAATFLERMYVNAGCARLPPGRCRYGLLLREDGFLFDDGIIARLAADRFHVTTTTGGAARVLHMMEDYLQTEWPDLRVWLTSTTEHWAVIAVQGPRARDVVAPLVEGIEPRRAARIWAWSCCTVAGVAARLFRVSFTGERGYEINVPAGHAPAVWQALLQEGAAHGHGALRHRGHARAARREGLHHHRPGNRRRGDARRCRPGRAWSRNQSRTSSASMRWTARRCAAPAADSSSACCPSAARCRRKARN